MTHSHDVQGRALRIALVANATFLVIELVGAAAFNSLALLADAAHLLTDVAALAIALLAQRLMRRPATTRHTYGLQRAEVIGAQANALLLLFVAGFVVFEAARRLGHTAEISGRGLFAVAFVGLWVTVLRASVIARHAGYSLNMRGAFLHMALD